jgi:spermidine/putrescine transport system substrate-binding protein
MGSRLLLLCLALCLLFSGCSRTDTPAQSSGKTTINVYNWGQYISDGTDGYLDVNKAFTEETGIEVNYITYDSNETMYTKLKTGGSSYDVIIPSDYMVARLISENMLLPLNYDNIPNAQYIMPAYRGMAHDPTDAYSIPYTWGCTGIIYNTKYVDEADVGSWDLLWNEKYSGKILMFDNPRDAFGVAELRLGYDVNTTNEQELEACAELLKQQKPLVQAYFMDQMYSALEHEEAWIGVYYAGDFIQMQWENEALAFCFPREGFNLFVDAFCIPTCCQNKDAAEAYINFLCRPDICGQNMDYLGYSVPIRGATDYMDEEMASNPVAYPDDATLARGYAFLNLPAEINQKMDSLWLDVRTGGSNSRVLLFGVIGAVVVIALLVILLVSRKNRLKKRRAMYQNQK